jgi:hypothetical protein
LIFYHFSGLDSGAQETMLKLYGRSSPVLFELRRWYLAECERMGQAYLGSLPCVYSRFGNGQPIAKVQRVLYRERPDLQAAFPDPFSTDDVNQSYWHWFEANAAAEQAPVQTGDGAAQRGSAGEAVARQELAAARQELDAIKRSRSWKVARMLSKAASAWR